VAAKMTSLYQEVSNEMEQAFSCASGFICLFLFGGKQ
jgi:hypothetical protein